MNRSNYYILDGKIPIPTDDVLVWGRWLEDHREDRIVRQDDIGHFWVSTVFMGLDFNFLDEGPPIIFETMVFDREKITVIDGREFKEDVFMDRYSTWELALEGHIKACDWAREQLS